MTELTVSVIIPNYNHCTYLQRRIDAVLQQSFQNFELIILDDYSTDDSRNVIENYRGHPKVSSITYNQKNSGSTFKQWQKGLRLAKGQWIWIAESDDFNDPTFLETALTFLNKYQSASLFFCQSKSVDESDKETGDMHWWTDSISAYNWNHPFCVSGNDFSAKALLQKNPIANASAVVFRNRPELIAHLDKVGQYKTCGDWLFWSFVIKDHDVVYTPEKLNYFRFHNNTTRSDFSRIKMLRRVLEEVSVKQKIRTLYRLTTKSATRNLKMPTLKYQMISRLSKVINLVWALNLIERTIKSHNKNVKQLT